MKIYKREEFYTIVNDIINNDEFLKLKNISHHGITRYEHCLRVGYYTYIVTKSLGLNYIKATRASVLHDFFIDEVSDMNSIFRLRRHSNYAVMNAKKYFEIGDLEEDIIRRHMFPITFVPPKYLESWIVDIIDDFAAIYEKSVSTKNEFSAATTFLFLLVLSIFR